MLHAKHQAMNVPSHSTEALSIRALVNVTVDRDPTRAHDISTKSATI